MLLSENDWSVLMSEIVMEEVKEMMIKAVKHKAPGLHRKPWEFYFYFWDIMGNDVVEIMRLMFARNEMTFKRGLVVLLFKKGEWRCFWRALTLLNTDYKIFATFLVNGSCFNGNTGGPKLCGPEEENP